MRIVKVEVTFSREELEEQKRYNSKEVSSKCLGVNCSGIDCDFCPIANLSREEVIEYMENHLE